MPQPPEDLSKLIRQMARDAAQKRGSSLSKEAEERIGRIPSDYAKMETIPVDQAKLRSTIDDVIELATEPRKKIVELDDMEKALGKVECHYLWFC